MLYTIHFVEVCTDLGMGIFLHCTVKKLHVN